MVESMVTNRQSNFTQTERDAVYRAIRERRDVRSGYLPRPLENDVLLRVLNAAHMAPSVGLMQPWRFIVVRDAAQRDKVHEVFLRAREAAAALYQGDRHKLYARLKLEALL
jgi:5,6-dimethylbenzimidazole synthase